MVEERLAGDHRVLPGAEVGEAAGDEGTERRLGLRRGRREAPRAVLAPGSRPLPAVEVTPHVGIDLVLLRLPRIRRGQTLARRAPVLGVEVPAPADRFAVALDQDLEAPALLAVEVLHPQPLAPARPLGEPLGAGEELVRVDEADAEALEAPPRADAVRGGADDVGLLGQGSGEARHRPPLDHLDLTGLAQLGGEVAHRAEDEVRAAPVHAKAAQGRQRLDEQDPPGPLERRVVAHQLIAEDQRGVACRHAAQLPRPPVPYRVRPRG